MSAPHSNRVIDVAAYEAETARLETLYERAKQHGQLLSARIRPSSKYFGQNDGELFSVAIKNQADYCVDGGPGGQYRLKDVDLFAQIDGAWVQITFLGG